MTESTSRQAQALPRRSELRTEDTWDLESIFATNAEWETARAGVEERLPALAAYQGRVGESAMSLLNALQLHDQLRQQVDQIEVYAHLRRAEDATNAESAALAEQPATSIQTWRQLPPSLNPRFSASIRIRLTPSLPSEPDLEIYRHYFTQLGRMRDHVRSAEVEELLAQANNVMFGFASVRGALENADLDLGKIEDADGNVVQLGQGNLQTYLRDSDRRVRQQAWTSAADAYLSMKNSFAGTLAGGVKRDVFEMRARNFSSSLEASLYPNAIPVEVFHNLVDTVWKNLPTWHKYFEIRKRTLNLDVQHEWDITASLTKNGPVIPFDDGMEMILESLAPLGGEYVEIVRQGVADRWVDAWANIGKGGGAFSAGSKGTLPFISMSYQNDLSSVSTLTHELGHSMHSYYTWQNQPVIYSQYSMFVAEAASNMHQTLLGRHLFGQDRDRAFQIAMIEERMGNHLRYFFTMPILAKFELECHEMVERGEALTAESMIDTLAGIYNEAYGGRVEVDHDRMGITWARFPHLFANFYVFQYATGISAAAAMGQQVVEEGEPARKRYLDFLKAGDSKFPIDALRDAGIDMLGPAPVQAAFDILAGYVDRLDELTR
jgi:oligoendopeptidase F